MNSTIASTWENDDDDVEDDWEVIEITGERMENDWEGDWENDWEDEDDDRRDRQEAYLECLTDSLAGKDDCIEDLEEDIAFWSDVCVVTATAGGVMVSVVGTPISGTVLAGVGVSACIVAKNVDLALVDNTCDEEIEDEWGDCWADS